MFMYAFLKDGYRRADLAGAGGQPAQRPHRPTATASTAVAGNGAIRSGLQEHREEGVAICLAKLYFPTACVHTVLGMVTMCYVLTVTFWEHEIVSRMSLKQIVGKFYTPNLAR